jgi:hypothetical protein
MRVYVEIDEKHLSALRELAREHYRAPRHHAAWLLAEAIERAISKRARARDRHDPDPCETVEVGHAPALV